MKKIIEFIVFYFNKIKAYIRHGILPVIALTIVIIFGLSVFIYSSALLIDKYILSKPTDKQYKELMETNTRLNRELILKEAEIYDLTETIKEIENIKR